MARKSLVIGRPSDLDRLRVIPGLRYPGLGRIRLAPDKGLDSQNRVEFEHRLNRHYFACGCDMAASFMAMAMVGLGAWAVLGDIHLGRFAPWLIGVMTVIIAGAVGKFLGKVRADRQFREVVGELKRVWRVPLETSDEILKCG